MVEKKRTAPDANRFPAYGAYGLLLLLIAWFFNWGMSGLRTHLLFFPQWLGYCLVVDALTRFRSGTSLLTRDPRGYSLLFLVSIPAWWLFEGLNQFTGNWHYLGRAAFSSLEFFLYSSLSFSTVIPAVFGTAGLLGTFAWTRSAITCSGFKVTNRLLAGLHATGWVMLVLMILFPGLFFPFMWLALVFILDSLNAFLGRRSMIRELASGNGRALILYGLAALICGFFWELWNFYAFPKWVYTIPYLDVLHIFEMPLAGYGGYIPFGWELFAIASLAGLGRLLSAEDGTQE